MKTNTIALIVLSLVLAAGAYWYFSSQSGNQAPLTASSAVAGNAVLNQFQVLVTQLRPITFNTAIFSDSKFTSLVNFSVPVTPEPSGRLDPFAPIPGVTTL